MKVVIADDYQNCARSLKCFTYLKDHDVTLYVEPAKSEKELIERFIQADVIVIVRERIRITQAILEALPKLKLISLVGRHSKMIDFEACTKLGIPVAHGVSSSPFAPAELTLALIFAARRNVVLEASRMQAGQFPITLSHRIHGSTLGIFGLGVIGEIVAKSAQAMGMQIVVWGRKASLDKAKSLGYGVADSKESFFSSADVISLHLRYSKETQGIVQESDLALMKPTALIVNTARAELIASGALENALNLGRPGFAAVDVYENEPILDGKHPLLKMPNVICMPHLGWADHDTFEMYFGEAFEQVHLFANNLPLRLANPNVLNK